MAGELDRPRPGVLSGVRAMSEHQLVAELVHRIPYGAALP